MGIQEIIAYGGPRPGGVDRTPAGAREARNGERGEKSDLFVISSEARSLYEAGEIQKFDAIRERVRLGYYLKGDVLDQVVDALAREVSAENPSQVSV
jgi:hypothetical protein